MHVLKDLIKSIRKNAPMRVVPWKDFLKFGKLPRSSDRLTVDVTEVEWNAKLVFISHRWLRCFMLPLACQNGVSTAVFCTTHAMQSATTVTYHKKLLVSCIGPVLRT
jgi:hypothetical protein